MKEYIFNWSRNEKYIDSIVRNTRIKSNNPQSATSIFMYTFGNLKINNINYIQEINPITGENIGEPIIPDEGTVKIPEGMIV